MSAGARFLTIAGRWRQHVELTGLDKVVDKETLQRLMLMFYAGFTACQEAQMEIAAYPENEAMQLMSALMSEGQQVSAMAERVVTGQRPS
ncbi:MAG TPA: hypothetical protein VEB23_08260 [Ramlibacter sp.]|nr:hypothetical protein [Ramlibacter sp.]